MYLPARNGKNQRDCPGWWGNLGPDLPPLKSGLAAERERVKKSNEREREVVVAGTER